MAVWWRDRLWSRARSEDFVPKLIKQILARILLQRLFDVLMGQ